MEILVLWFTLLLLSMTANIFMIISIYKSEKLCKNGCTKLIMSFLSSSAFACLCGSVSTTAMLVENSRDEHSKYPDEVWIVLFALNRGAVAAHLSTSSTMALIRMISVVWPVNYRSLNCSSAIYCFIVAPWVYSTVMFVLPLFQVIGVPDPSTYRYKIAEGETNLQKSWRITYILAYILIPFTLIYASYMIVFCKVHGLKRGNGSDGSQDHGLNNRPPISQWQEVVARAALANIIVQTVTYFPMIIGSTLSLGTLFSRICRTIFILQYIFNPVSFVMFSEDYRCACKKVLKCFFPQDSAQSDLLTEMQKMPTKV
ncbi:uncharacterized protein LOC135199086 [Macrobrachium nipponense]|uniref:uncharacterized protein LOC135199086 n=1 Tax=Macrobrachium nipponense TaxID=159736 RepID=UPI0030C80140